MPLVQVQNIQLPAASLRFKPEKGWYNIERSPSGDLQIRRKPVRRKSPSPSPSPESSDGLQMPRIIYREPHEVLRGNFELEPQMVYRAPADAELQSLEGSPAKSPTRDQLSSQTTPAPILTPARPPTPSARLQVLRNAAEIEQLQIKIYALMEAQEKAMRDADAEVRAEVEVEAAHRKRDDKYHLSVRFPRSLLEEFKAPAAKQAIERKEERLLNRQRQAEDSDKAFVASQKREREIAWERGRELRDMKRQRELVEERQRFKEQARLRSQRHKRQKVKDQERQKAKEQEYRRVKEQARQRVQRQERQKAKDIQYEKERKLARNHERARDHERELQREQVRAEARSHDRGRTNNNHRSQHIHIHQHRAASPPSPPLRVIEELDGEGNLFYHNRWRHSPRLPSRERERNWAVPGMLKPRGRERLVIRV